MFNVEFEEVTNQFCAEFDTVVHTGDATLGEKTITANGVYNASSDDLDGYSKVTANVPNTYAASDEGKVVSNGALVAQGSDTVTVNDTYDTTLISSLTVNVSGGGDTPVINSLSVTPTTSQQTFNESGVDGYKPVVVAAMPSGTEGTPTATKGAVSNHSVAVTPSVTNQAGYIEGGTKTGTAVTVSASELDSGTKSITANGNNQDVVGYAAVNVAVPNSYSASDEGKVVSNGALVAQTAHADVTPTASDQTIDTTTNNSIKVKGDADLVAANIKKDVEIFGVTGSYEGGGGGITVSDCINRTISGDIVITPLSTVSTTEALNMRYNNSITSVLVQASAAFTIASNGLRQCTGMTKFSCLPYNGYSGGVNIDGTGMQGCTNLEYVVGVYQLNAQALAGCSKLKAMDMICNDSTKGFTSTAACNGASALNRLIIRGTQVAKLNNINNFTGTPFESGKAGGILYVPSALISSYQAASNWSTILGYATNSIQAIEGSQYENYYADGTLIPT